MPTTYDTMSQRMSYLIARQSVLAGNIANASTPGYLSKDLTAPKAGEAAGQFGIMVTNAAHMAPVTSANAAGGRVVEDTAYIQHNGNSVRLDNEMAKMSEVQLDYRLMTQLYAKQVALQKAAIGKQ